MNKIDIGYFIGIIGIMIIGRCLYEYGMFLGIGLLLIWIGLYYWQTEKI